jgi:hypothetical protein
MKRSQLEHLNAWVGEWETEATHPMLPDTVVPGRISVEWLEGERFLLHRARNEHPDFPDSISVIGETEEGADNLTMHYFDSRGVFRVYGLSAEEGELKIWRDDPAFRQRFTGRFSDGSSTFAGTWELNEAEAGWNDDLKITYRRAGG